MLQNSRVSAFTVSKLLRENQQGGKLPSRGVYDRDLRHERVKKQTLMEKEEVFWFEHFYFQQLRETKWNLWDLVLFEFFDVRLVYNRKSLNLTSNLWGQTMRWLYILCKILFLEIVFQYGWMEIKQRRKLIANLRSSPPKVF